MLSFGEIIEVPGLPVRHTDKKDVLKGRIDIKKADDDKQYAFGWANVAVRTDGEQIIDYQKDLVDPDVLENAAYNFVEFYREAGEMHERGGAGVLIESVVFTKEKLKALGLSDDALPIGWWVGFHVTDDDVWQKVKDGTYNMFSIEGQAVRVPVDDKGEED